MQQSNMFGRICEIDPTRPESWQGRSFLTFDVDWACDEVLAFTLDMVEQADVCATWFITHDTALLGRMRENPKFQIGLHPNFNPLLSGSGDRSCDNARATLNALKEIAPEATALRSHSLTQSSQLLDMFRDGGITHDCNMYIPGDCGISLRPWRHWNGIVRVPHGWEDDIWVMEGAKNNGCLLDEDALCVIDIHPIHVALNTRELSDYENSRDVHRDWNALRKRSNCGHGVRSILTGLLETGHLL